MADICEFQSLGTAAQLRDSARQNLGANAEVFFRNGSWEADVPEVTGTGVRVVAYRLEFRTPCIVPFDLEIALVRLEWRRLESPVLRGRPEMFESLGQYERQKADLMRRVMGR